MKKIAALFVLLLFAVSGFAQNSFKDEIDKDLQETNKNKQKSKKRGGGPLASLAPDFFIALDMIFEGGTKRSSNAPNQAKIREIEFGYSANIDPYFFGMIAFVLENEGGEIKTDIHEAYIRYSGLLRGFSIRAGKLFMDLGILNTIHQHDRPFIDSPLVQVEMFAFESAADVGLEANYIPGFLPFYLRLNVGVYNGQIFGHAHSSGTAKRFPLLTSKLETFINLGEDLGVRIGLNHLIRSLDESDTGKYGQQYGLDLTIKGWQSKQAGFLILSEVWFKRNTVDDQQQIGMYALAQICFATHYALGIRYDYLKKTKPVAVKPSTAMVGFATLKPSEFSLFRVQYKYLEEPTTTGQEHLIQGQISFILGAHPAHKY